MAQIDIIKKMIEDAKNNNDQVAVEYYTKALEREEKIQKNEEVLKTVTRGKTTLTTFKNGNVQLASEYMDVKVDAKNKMIKHELQHILVSISVDELKEKTDEKPKSISELKSLVSRTNTEEDLNDISNYLDSVAKVGDFGTKISESMQRSILMQRNQLTGRTENYDISLELGLNSIKKKIDMIDMELDEKTSASMKNPDDFYDIAGKYEKQIKELESLLQSVVESKMKEEIKRQIDDLQNRVTKIRRYAQGIEEAARMSFQM